MSWSTAIPSVISRRALDERSSHSSLDDLIASRPDEAALRVFKEQFLQTMVVEIVQETGDDMIRAQTVDDDDLVHNSFKHVVAP